MYEMKLQHTKFIPPKEFLKPVVIGVVVIPISLFLWMFGVLRSNYLSSAAGNYNLNSLAMKFCKVTKR